MKIIKLEAQILTLFFFLCVCERERRGGRFSEQRKASQVQQFWIYHLNYK